MAKQKQVSQELLLKCLQIVYVLCLLTQNVFILYFLLLHRVIIYDSNIKLIKL